MAREDRTRFFFYERAADDMVLGIPKGDGSWVRLFRRRFCQPSRAPPNETF